MSTYQIPSDVVTDVATKTFVNNMLPAGTVIIWAGSTTPEGYLLCDGSAISRTTYSALFSAIGTTYGTGDGSTTFNLPNFQGRYLKQGTVGTYGSESLPAFSGSLINSIVGFHDLTATGCFTKDLRSSYGMSTVGLDKDTNWFDIHINPANVSSSVYKNSAKVNPDNAEILYCIKY